MDLSEILDKFKTSNSLTLTVTTFETLVGQVIAVADHTHLLLLSFEDSKNLKKMLQHLHQHLSCSYKLEPETKNVILLLLKKELSDYFGGQLKKFTVPVKTFGSDFQRQVWEKLQELPYSSTQSYGDLAKAMGRAASHARAIGGACGANTHVIVIPCHRLVAAGSVGGFSCGPDRKEWLLQHEKKYAT